MLKRCSEDPLKFLLNLSRKDGIHGGYHYAEALSSDLSHSTIQLSSIGDFASIA
jgi:hypothetical protein